MQQQQSRQWEELIGQVKITIESLIPISIIKNTVHELATSCENKSNIIGSVMALAGGYLSKKVFFKHSVNPLKRLAGTLFQTAVFNLISNNSEYFRSAASTIFSKIQKLRNESKMVLYK